MVKNAADLGMDEWIYLIRANNLLKGLVMGTGAASDDPGPTASTSNVVSWLFRKVFLVRYIAC
jgi:hypothetical protein